MAAGAGSARTPGYALTTLAGVLASALLLGLYARSDLAWPLGFVALVPWLSTLQRSRSWGSTLLGAWAMSVGFVLAVLGWFAFALDAYLGLGVPLSLLLLAIAAPLLQPQLFAYAIVRRALGAPRPWWLRAAAGAAAWVACEACVPRLFGDTLGHGLHAAAWLRQGADLGGATGLTLVLLLVNEALAQVWTQRRERAAWLWPALAAALLPLLLAGYGAWRLHALHAGTGAPAPSMRVALVQANLTDYERRRREEGSHAVVRDVLDTHFALTRAALEHHGAEAVLWSETVYPTTYGQPQSEDGAAFDAQIAAFAATHALPLVFGSFEREAGREYNAAVVLDAAGEVVGRYRKTYPFPLTEHVPPWLDRPALRRALPWLGGWQPGDGARVLPLRLRDGRALDVVPLICRDDVVPQLAIDGARLGARAIVGLSNDAWFLRAPQGARLHLKVAAFRSVETRLPQLRVTTNGISAYVDPTGAIVAHTAMGDRAVLAGAVALRDPPSTLMVRWGDWVGRAGALFLVALALAAGAQTWRARRAGRTLAVHQAAPAEVVLLSPLRRRTAAALRVGAGLVLAWLAWRMAWIDGWQVQSLAPLRAFAFGVLVPLLVAWRVQRDARARLLLAAGMLRLESRALQAELPLSGVATVQAWARPLPGAGVDLRLHSGRRFAFGLRVDDPVGLYGALQRAGADLRWADAASERRARDASARARARWPRLDHAGMKFGVFPLLLALPAFRLHQHIAFGGTFGEAYTYGAGAWLAGLAIWWGAWAIGLMLFAAALRLLGEGAAWLAGRGAASDRGALRARVEAALRALYYLGVPAWMLLRLAGG